MFKRLFLFTLLFVSTKVLADEIEDRVSKIEAKIARMERVLGNELSIETFKQISQLEEEVREIVGTLETQAHDIHLIQKKQEEVQVSKVEQPQQPSAKEDSKLTPIISEFKSEKEQYQAAYKLVQKKQYSAAIRGLQEFMKKYPNSEYYVHAQYWVGDIYLTEWQFNKDNELLSEKANKSFSDIVARYPESSRVPDSLLKLGVIAEELGNWRLAANYLQDVKQHYPNSTSARIAHIRLQKMEQEGLL